MLDLRETLLSASRELQDKADILSLIQNNLDQDWVRIKRDSDLFDQWDVIQKLRDLK